MIDVKNISKFLKQNKCEQRWRIFGLCDKLHVGCFLSFISLLQNIMIGITN